MTDQTERGQSPDPEKGGGETGGRAGARGVEGIEPFDLQMPDDAKHCYRHPRRETGVSCSRCGRPICSECMIPAPVGFQCPECVGRTKAERRAAPVVSRGQIRDRWAGRTGAPVTRALVGINVAVYLLMALTGGSLTQAAGPIYRWGALYLPSIVFKDEYWRLVTPMFVHASFWHIAMNMFSLWVIGSMLEPMIGSARFTGIYFVAGLAGNVLAIVLAPVTPMVGASTAIFGIFGALFVFALHDRGTLSDPLVRVVGFWLVLNLVLNFVGPFSSIVSWQGHIGGLLGGLMASEALVWFGRRPLRRAFQRSDALLLLAVAAFWLAVAILKITTFTG